MHSPVFIIIFCRVERNQKQSLGHTVPIVVESAITTTAVDSDLTSSLSRRNEMYILLHSEPEHHKESLRSGCNQGQSAESRVCVRS